MKFSLTLHKFCANEFRNAEKNPDDADSLNYEIMECIIPYSDMDITLVKDLDECDCNKDDSVILERPGNKEYLTEKFGLSFQ